MGRSWTVLALSGCEDPHDRNGGVLAQLREAHGSAGGVALVNVLVLPDLFGYVREGRWWRQRVLHKVFSLTLRSTSSDSLICVIAATSKCGKTLHNCVLTQQPESPKRCADCFG